MVPTAESRSGKTTVAFSPGKPFADNGPPCPTTSTWSACFTTGLGRRSPANGSGRPRSGPRRLRSASCACATAPAVTSRCRPTPTTITPATCSSTWIPRGPRPSPLGVLRGMNPGSSGQPAPLLCQPGCASAPRRWNRRWQAPPANSGRQLRAAIRPARTGVLGAGSPGSPPRSPHGAQRATPPPGSSSSARQPGWRRQPKPCGTRRAPWHRRLQRSPSTPPPRGTILSPPPWPHRVAAELEPAGRERWHIRPRFPPPDWRLVDCWVARHGRGRRGPPAPGREILRRASPQFPRRPSDPHDYLRRPSARAAFPFPPRPGWADPTRASLRLDTPRTGSHSPGGRYPHAEGRFGETCRG